MDYSDKKTVILGASPNPDRASYQAMINLKEKGVPFVAVGRRDYEWGGIKITKGKPAELGKVHTVTLYLNAVNQQEYYDYILSLHPERIIFNPGTKNDELHSLATENGIEVVERCMLVMLKTGAF